MEQSVAETLIIIGRSGSGKGTQATLAAEYLGRRRPAAPVFYLETGNRLREFIRQPNCWSSQLAREIMNSGGFLPSFLAIKGWAELLVENLTGKEHLIIDGTPRTLIEAEALDTALTFYRRSSPTVLYLETSPEEVRRRLLLRGRDDDTSGGISRRLDLFEKDVRPILDFYRQRSVYRFIEINGDQSVEKVQTDILKQLEDL